MPRKNTQFINFHKEIKKYILNIKQNFYKITFYTILLLVSNTQVFSQNLIQNGKFDNFTRGFELYNKESSQIKSINVCNSWNSSGLGASLIYKSQFDSLFSFGENGNMARMYYSESCPFGEPTGCFSYLQQKLKSELKFGHEYEMTFSFYMEPNEIAEKSIYRSFGVYFSKVNEVINDHDLLDEYHFIPFDFESGKWNNIKIRFRAICDLNFITIGVFRHNEFPTIHRKIDNPIYFYIDNISLIPVNTEILDSDVVPYCEYFEHKKKEVLSIQDSLVINFGKGEYGLTTRDSVNIIEFYDQYVEFGHPLIIEGYTSSIGNELDNLTLSSKRAATVMQLINKSKDVAPNDIWLRSFGESKSSFHENNANFRKVVVYYSPYSKKQHFYEEIINELNRGKQIKAFKMLMVYIDLYFNETTIHILFDKRLDIFRNREKWQLLVNLLKEKYPNYNKFFLDSMYCEDQKYRGFDYEISRLGAEKLKASQYDFALNNNYEHVRELDCINATAIELFIKEYGLPTIRQYGINSIRSTYYIIKHCGNIELIDQYIDELYNLCQNGEVECYSYAIWKDTQDIFYNRPQTFGTQIDYSKHNAKSKFGASLQEINQRRIRIGLNKI